MKNSPKQSSAAIIHPEQVPELPPPRTIAQTIGEHQSDPRHRFHTGGIRPDYRSGIAAGARIQRMRGRSHAN